MKVMSGSHDQTQQIDVVIKKLTNLPEGKVCRTHALIRVAKPDGRRQFKKYVSSRFKDLKVQPHQQNKICLTRQRYKMCCMKPLDSLFVLHSTNNANI